MAKKIPFGLAPKGERVVIVGDSVTAGNVVGGATAWMSPDDTGASFYSQMAARYPGIQPIWMPSGNPGDTVANIVTNATARIYQFRPTRVIVQALTNDTGTSLSQLQNTDIPNLINGIRANCPFLVDPGAIHWVGVWLIGEKWDGTNATDPQITALNNLLFTMADILGFQAIDVRTSTIAALKLLNPSNLGFGILTPSAGDASGKHPIPIGARYITTPVLAQLP